MSLRQPVHLVFHEDYAILFEGSANGRCTFRISLKHSISFGINHPKSTISPNFLAGWFTNIFASGKQSIKTRLHTTNNLLLAITPIDPSAYFVIRRRAGITTSRPIATMPVSVTIAIARLPNSDLVFASSGSQQTLPNLIYSWKDRSPFLFFGIFSSLLNRNNARFFGIPPIFVSRHNKYLQILN